MWFSSKHTKKKSSSKGKTRFLRKALPKRREGRAVPKENKSGSGIFVSVLFLWLLFFATLGYVAFFSPFFVIGTPRISGMHQISPEALNTSLESQLAGKHLNILPKRNFFLFRPSALETFLRNEYPLLASATVVRVFPDGLSLSVTEREKMIVWCVIESLENVEENISSKRNCFLIDEAGRAGDASRALAEENISAVLFVTDTSGRVAVEGDRVFDSDYGRFILQLNRLFAEQIGIGLGVEYTTVSRFANEVRAKTHEGWEVYFNTEIPIEASLSALKLLFEKELPQERRTGLAYIDLRTENRVYYAFREENVATGDEAVLSDTPPPEQKADESKKKKE